VLPALSRRAAAAADPAYDGHGRRQFGFRFLIAIRIAIFDRHHGMLGGLPRYRRSEDARALAVQPKPRLAIRSRRNKNRVDAAALKADAQGETGAYRGPERQTPRRQIDEAPPPGPGGEIHSVRRPGTQAGSVRLGPFSPLLEQQGITKATRRKHHDVARATSHFGTWESTCPSWCRNFNQQSLNTTQRDDEANEKSNRGRML